MKWYIKCLDADFSGRARRKEYWMFILFSNIFSIIPIVLDQLSGTYFVLTGFFWLALLIPSIAVSVRRLHDIGKSGWNYCIVLIPFVGRIILLVWLCKKGDYGDNAWGKDPKQIED